MFLSQWEEMGVASILSERDVHIDTSYSFIQVVSMVYIHCLNDNVII